MSKRDNLLKQIDIFLEKHPKSGSDDDGDLCDELLELLEQAAPILEIRGLRFITTDGNEILFRAFDWFGWPDPCHLEWPEEAQDEWYAQLDKFYAYHERAGDT